jgi:ornithine cyclodeaminase/alanine dehydrogenase-like protein (mu-crystallin family)
MTLHISESEVRTVLSMPLALEAVGEISRRQGDGEVLVHARRRFEFPANGFFHQMAGADMAAGYVATKQYTYVRGKLRFVVLLFDMSTGELISVIEADYMGQLRTGAASGVATKFLARHDASIAAIIGTGGQARTQLEAVAAVRKLASVCVYGRDAAKREAFCREMSVALGVNVAPASSASEAVRGAHIVCTATTASQPVVSGADLSPGVHINAIGANHAHKRELDDEAVAQADAIFVDSLEQSKQEAGDLILAFEKDASRWNNVTELAQVVSGKAAGRSNTEQITLFKSNGIASWDLAVAMKVYALARKQNLGRPLPLWNS